jgi:hypothetical protein
MPLFTFELLSFGINNTRALHNDTDYIGLGLNINGAPQTPLVHRQGDVNNGIHQVNLSFPLVNINPSDEVVFSYLIINHGGGKSAEVLSACANAMTQTPLATFDTTEAALVSVPGGNVPNCLASPLNTDLEIWWNERGVKAQFSGISSNHCDGPVAIGRFSIPGSFMGQLVTDKNSSNPWTTINTGINSAIGCGSNSEYGIQWIALEGLDRIPPRGL